ncbi:hypothetical protein B0O99DRAFT_622479 [Bisporella sp. PMI_857]|nr:hypothetical protein B0O99DRAFT_622479 [Bisporella sp. PMI_857]
MSNAALVRRILSTPPGLRSALIFPWIIAPSRLYLTASMSDRSYSSVPAIASTSFWKTMIPKPFRKSSNSKPVAKKPKSKEWNPATFFIIIFLLIGSMSIQMIALRNSFAAFSRRADARISLLREIIERVQNGEKVDVEGLLGTGNKQREEEWEEGMFYGNIIHGK